MAIARANAVPFVVIREQEEFEACKEPFIIVDSWGTQPVYLISIPILPKCHLYPPKTVLGWTQKSYQIGVGTDWLGNPPLMDTLKTGLVAASGVLGPLSKCKRVYWAVLWSKGKWTLPDTGPGPWHSSEETAPLLGAAVGNQASANIHNHYYTEVPSHLEAKYHGNFKSLTGNMWEIWNGRHPGRWVLKNQ